MKLAINLLKYLYPWKDMCEDADGCTRANAIAGRHTPGMFTNQMQTSFSEPTLLILTDPCTNHQPIKEGALGNIRIIFFCDTDSPMRCVEPFALLRSGMSWEPEESKPEDEDADFGLPAPEYGDGDQ
ncbi:40S ribosomal protein Sa-1 [Raphanus sativus]|nr:40S ribosomal protein Sa-1 [Raphanus sativus]